VTWHSDGYALEPGTALEDLDMGAGSMLSVRVSGEQSGGLVTVIEGVIREGGPSVHVHEAEDEVVVVLDGELAYRVGEKQGVLGAGGLMARPRRWSDP
jgi:hypothetical protein